MLATALRFVRLETIPTPIQAALVKARSDRRRASKASRTARERLKTADPSVKRRIDLDLFIACRNHSEAVWLEKACKTAIEKRANELGLTTVRTKAV